MLASFRTRNSDDLWYQSKGDVYMKKVIYKAKYYWHSFQYNKHKVLLEDCLSGDIKTDIKTKMQYHERAAVNYIAKF